MPAVDLTKYDAVLLDLDGTVYHSDHALPGAVDLIRALQQRGARYACLSNSTSTPQHVVPRLRHMGITIDVDHVYTAAGAACDHVLDAFGGAGRPHVYNLATEGVHEYLDDRVHWVQSAADVERCDAVIAGTLTSVFATEDRLRTGLEILRRHRDAALVGICADRVYPSSRGIEFGSGALTMLLSYAANLTPFFTGKPQRVFFEKLCGKLGVAPERCVLVGDNPESDIAGARTVNMPTILTLSGVATRRDAENLPERLRPDFVVEDLRELL